MALLKFISGVAVSLLFQAPANAGGFDAKAQSAFVKHMQDTHQFAAADLNVLFAEAQLLPGVLKAISTPAETKPWFVYKDIFLTAGRLRAAVEFARTHQQTLTRAEQDYGVDASIITAIIGVETFFGQKAGNYRVLESLATLAFNYPKRSEFFTKELEHYLLLTREQNLPPLEMQGSYAGAMGMPQFMPSSYRHYAVDFNGDQRVDIWRDVEDVIGSVANYLKVHGWQHGGVVASFTEGDNDTLAGFVQKDAKTIYKFADLGTSASVSCCVRLDSDVAVVKLDTSESAAEYWITQQNFYAITRYNTSKLYAMAVYQLSELIKQQLAAADVHTSR